MKDETDFDDFCEKSVCCPVLLLSKDGKEIEIIDNYGNKVIMSVIEAETIAEKLKMILKHKKMAQ